MDAQSVGQGSAGIPGGDADHGSSDPGSTERNSVDPPRTQDVFAVDGTRSHQHGSPSVLPGASIRPLTLAP